jgi:MFS family permease
VRIHVGWLGDRVESRWIYFGSIVAVLIGLIGIWKAPSYALLLIFGPIYGVGYGSILVIGPTLLGNYYGPEVYPGIRAFFTPWLTILTFGVPAIAGYSQDKLGSYNEVFFVLTVLVAIGVVFSAMLPPPKKKVDESLV